MDQNVVNKLNNLTEKQQIDVVLARAKEHAWKIYMGTQKMAMRDRKNFHILTDNNIMLQRMEYKNYLQHQVVTWSIVKKDTNERIEGDYGTIICKFVEEYEKTHQAICL